METRAAITATLNFPTKPRIQAMTTVGQKQRLTFQYVNQKRLLS